ncbi:kinase-like domain-containing protein [Mycena metata]|uniref:Kinase-like domain-containing protein n=1 Tax=Mycena metata TaxID=1033252 RepID=A0AAD7JRN7_9AGAR|nr:kinase-like domain-containing protein [Mycena metata]
MTSNDVVGVVVNSLQCRRTLLELAAEFGLREDPNLRHSLRADEAELVSHVVKILDSKAQETVVLSLVGNAAQSFIDVVQDILDRGSVLERTQGKKARRIIRKLSEACDKLPSALFVTGVSGCPTHPTFGGGFGDVYCASHGGKAVALKVMRHFSESAESRNIRLNICREALVWRGLHHPHILPFIGIDRDTFPSLAIVSPWMEQGTVLNHLDRHGRADVDKLLFQIAQGIGYLHSRNIVHGDLRGANILVNDNWTACLADFGLSNFTDPISTASSTKRAGSLYWMAPELLDPNRYGRKFVRTPATDVYAFGCVCVELYTGRPPLSDLPGPAVIFPILNGERAPRPMGPPTMSDTLWQNVTNYWAADPEARPSSDIMTQQM